MTAPAITPNIPTGNVREIAFDESDDAAFLESLGPKPPDPVAPPVAAPATTAPAPEAGVSVSAQPQAEAAPDVEVEEVELTAEQADAERVAAGWKKNAITNKWQKPDGKFAAENELPAGEREEQKPKRELLAQFEVKRKGATVDPLEIADDEITYTANGKTVTRKVDHLVKMAQMGEHNETREQEYRTTREAATTLTARNETLSQTNTRLRKWVASILEDTEEANDRIYKAREGHARSNSPEERLRRVEQRERQIENRERSTQDDAQYNATSERIGALMDGLEQKYPNVMREAVIGKYNMLMLDYLVDGKLPPPKLSLFEAALTSSLVPWVEQLHEQTQSKTASERAAAKLEIDKAKGATIQAKRTVSRVWKPAVSGNGVVHTKPKGSPGSIKGFMREEFGDLE